MGARPHCKAVFGRKFPVKNSRKSPVKIGPQMAVFRELRGVNVKFLFSDPEKAHPLRGTALFGVLRVKIGSGV